MNTNLADWSFGPVSYPVFMVFRVLLTITLATCAGCHTTSPEISLDCPEAELAEWEIPAGSLDRSLTPEQAFNRVLTGNLPIDGIRDRWQELADRWRSGDQYWAYTLEEEQLINGIGGQEGIVLKRGCRQLGFVTTSVALE